MDTNKPIYIDLSNLKDDLTSDQVFNVLSNARRRYTLYCLYQAGGELPLEEIAERLAAYENDTTVPEITETERRNMYISLYQTHLPKLSEYGLARYDENERRAYLTAQALEAEAAVGTDDHPWHVYYGSMAAVGVTAIAGVWLEVLPPTGLSWTLVALVTLLGLLLVAVMQYLFADAPTRASGGEYFRLDDLV
jgi:hypothetical protein